MVQTVFHRGRAERKLTPELTPLVKKKEARQGDHLSGLFRGQVAGKLQGATTKKEKQPYERRREEGEAGTDKGGDSGCHAPAKGVHRLHHPANVKAHSCRRG